MTDCEHRWVSIGVSTICEPPIAHHACPKCRTFRHSRLGDLLRGEPAVTKEWFTKEWAHGPFSWDELEME